MKLFDKTFDGIEKAMDVRFKRHAVLSSNVANVETPNYRAREFDFAGEVAKALGRGEELLRTSSKHMDISSSEGAHIILDNSGAMKADGNNVDLDLTMGRLSTNASALESAANYLTLKLRMLKAAAKAGGSGGE